MALATNQRDFGTIPKKIGSRLLRYIELRIKFMTEDGMSMIDATKKAFSIVTKEDRP